MQINDNYGSYSRKCHKDFGLPQNDIGVGSGRVGRAFALHQWFPTGALPPPRGRLLASEGRWRGRGRYGER